MTSKPSPDQLADRARRLGLYGLLARWQELGDQRWVATLIDCEEAERGRRSLERRIRTSFVTRLWVTAKSKDEMVNGTSTRGPAKTPFKRCDSMAQAWRKLKKRAGVEDWREGFYVWRHLGATAYASLPGTGIAQLRTYLGHGKSNAADEYLKPLTPETKQVVEWINETLDAEDLNAWKKKPKKRSVKKLP